MDEWRQRIQEYDMSTAKYITFCIHLILLYKEFI